MDQNIADLIKSARDMATREPSLAVYILRDIEVVKSTSGTDRDLYSLAWALSQDHGCTQSEALWFIGLVEETVKAPD